MRKTGWGAVHMYGYAHNSQPFHFSRTENTFSFDTHLPSGFLSWEQLRRAETANSDLSYRCKRSLSVVSKIPKITRTTEGKVEGEVRPPLQFVCILEKENNGQTTNRGKDNFRAHAPCHASVTAGKMNEWHRPFLLLFTLSILSARSRIYRVVRLGRTHFLSGISISFRPLLPRTFPTAYHERYQCNRMTIITS